MKTLILVLALTVASCAKAPASLSPTGARTYQANQAVIAIGTVQHAAIELNAVMVCTPAPCHPFLSDANTGIVVDNVTSALTTIKSVPTGWKATIQAALSQIQQRLDAAGKRELAAYLTAANTILASL